MFYQKLNRGDVSVYSKYRNFVPTTKLKRTYSILKIANKRDKGGWQRTRNWELVEFCCTSANLGFSLTILQGGDRDVTVTEYVMRTVPKKSGSTETINWCFCDLQPGGNRLMVNWIDVDDSCTPSVFLHICDLLSPARGWKCTFVECIKNTKGFKSLNCIWNTAL